VEDSISQQQRFAKMGYRAPKVKTNKHGKIYDLNTEQELERRALAKVKHLDTYDPKTGLFGLDPTLDREMKIEMYRVKKDADKWHQENLRGGPEGQSPSFQSPRKIKIMNI